MERWIQLLPECYADTLLIDILGYKNPNHQPSISEVANAMSHRGYKNQLAIGVIDKDKNMPAYFADFEVLKRTESLELKKHPQKKHYTIILCPAFEVFIQTAAEEVKIDLAKFGFGNLKYFKSVCKSIHAAKNQNLKQLLNTINQKQAPSTEQIKNWINEIIENK